MPFRLNVLDDDPKPFWRHDCPVHSSEFLWSDEGMASDLDAFYDDKGKWSYSSEPSHSDLAINFCCFCGEALKPMPDEMEYSKKYGLECRFIWGDVTGTLIPLSTPQFGPSS